MIKYLGLMQQVCLLVKADNIYRPRNDGTDLPASWFEGMENEGECPASDKCPLYQYCAAGRSHGVVQGAYGPTTVKLLEEPNIVPWTAEQMLKIADIVNDYPFPHTEEDETEGV